MKRRRGGACKPFSRLKKTIIHGCNVLLFAIEKDSGIAALAVNFSKRDASLELTGLSISTGLRGMLKGKDFEAIDMVFPFVAAFIHRVTRNDDTAPMTTVHTTYTKLANRLMKDWKGKKISVDVLGGLKVDIARLKEMMTATFNNHFETGL